MSKVSYTITHDSITVVFDGKPITVQRGATNFVPLRDALLAGQWLDARDHLQTANSLQRWARGRFTVDGDTISFDGQRLPSELNNRIVEMAANGADPDPLFKFWERLQLNPSARSVEQLWPFLNLVGIPLTSDGRFLAYKGVRTDYYDVHTGTILNTPGQIVTVQRNRVSDDPNTACHFGLHVGSLEYASSFGSRVVICMVDPRDVVCVPHDHSHQKMRVCEYTVVGHHGEGHMSSTTISDDDWDLDDSGDTAADESDESKDVEPKTFFLNERQEVREEAKQKLKSKSKVPVWAQILDAQDCNGLFEETMETLRRYATQRLKIVGASKIAGGKAALIDAIIAVRQ